MINLESQLIFVVKKEMVLDELHIYGSSRHGIHKPSVTLVNKTYKLNNIDSATDSSMALLNYKYFKRTLTYKQYELTNRLSNVLATVLDRKTFVGTDTLEYYQADVYTAGLYYAFGSGIEEMQYSSDTGNKYRYGFNGMEKDPESFTDAYDFGARIYDGRLGRWLAVDFLSNKKPDWTPYRYGFCSPVFFTDKTGNWEEDGHFWTVYAMGIAMGLENKHAIQLAMFAEFSKWLVLRHECAAAHQPLPTSQDNTC